MLIDAMPEVLTWRDNADVLCRVHDSYVGLLSDALGKLLAVEDRLEPAVAHSLREELGSASDAAFLRVLTAPETSYRLLWKDACTVGEACRFIARSLLAEDARNKESAPFNEDTWTAIGDACFRADGTVYRFVQLLEMPPLDFGSPLTAAVDFGGPGNLPGETREPFSDAELSLVLTRLEAAREGLKKTGHSILEFSNVFNKVLICQKDPAAPNMYSSGSTGQYVGRSFVTNPHLSSIDEVDLAEALVHEGIHSLLYMQERQKAWIEDPEIDRPIPRVESPWSGNKLTVRSYLQACFVWYGLANFWALAASRKAFDRGRIRNRTSMAVRGFLNPSMIDRLDPYLFAISPDLIDAIDRMQSTVVGAYAGPRDHTASVVGAGGEPASAEALARTSPRSCSRN